MLEGWIWPPDGWIYVQESWIQANTARGCKLEGWIWHLKSWMQAQEAWKFYGFGDELPSSLGANSLRAYGCGPTVSEPLI